jgi:ribonuclease BN (tRNA processing enzyme)
MNIKMLSQDEKLRLNNDGELSIFFIGVGSAFNKINFQTNLIIIKGDDHLLVDCGTLCSLILNKYGFPLTGIKNFLITHSHADHIGGLEEALLCSRYITKTKPNIIITEEYENVLWNESLKGGVGYNERRNGSNLEFEDMFQPIRPRLISRRPREYFDASIGGIKLKLFRTKHIPDTAQSWRDSALSYGLIIDDRIMFTSDTRYDPDLILDFLNLFPGLEFIFHDCQSYKGGVHASYPELLNLPADIRSRMVLTHYNEDLEKTDVTKDGFFALGKKGCYYTFG